MKVKPSFFSSKNGLWNIISAAHFYFRFHLNELLSLRGMSYPLISVSKGFVIILLFGIVEKHYWIVRVSHFHTFEMLRPYKILTSELIRIVRRMHIAIKSCI